MSLVKVRIKGLVITAQYGTLSDGDILNTNPVFAKHLVEDCQAAEYLTAETKLEQTDAKVSPKPSAKSSLLDKVKNIIK